uniref:Guanine nucleotide exchange factor DBS n=1 Tax=Strigamia maritima TaxID=126957 RepID=T1JN60_STRMM
MHSNACGDSGEADVGAMSHVWIPIVAPVVGPEASRPWSSGPPPHNFWRCYWLWLKLGGVKYDIMDETACPLTVRDVAELLQAQYAIITGGKARNGCPIIQFTDTGIFCNMSDDDYRKLIIYLTSVPSLQDADLGFVLVIDRRSDKWNSVKAVLLKISGFFPGLIQVVFVLRPTGIFQKAISEVSSKLFKEEFKFKVVICNCIEELHEHLDKNQLTRDLDGCIPYNHEEWIEQRIAVEKFFANMQDISQSLRLFIQRLQETELPNEAASTEKLLCNQEMEFNDLKRELKDANRHGETILGCLRRPSSSDQTRSVDYYPENKLINVTTVERCHWDIGRLLIQLEETERGFDDFWAKHRLKLQQCLNLRQFEQDFRELQINLDVDLKILSEMTEVGDSVSRVDELVVEITEFKTNCEDDMEKTAELHEVGLQLIANEHYAVDSIQPKCVELKRMNLDLRDKVELRIQTLKKYRDLQERIEKANKWCTRGVDLLASQQIEKCSSPEFAENALAEVEEFLHGSADFKLSNPKEFHTIFEDMITLETKALVQQVLQRIEDVQMMCDKRKSSLKKMAVRPPRPVQPVVPEPALPLTAPHSTQLASTENGSESPARGRKVLKKARTVPKMQVRPLSQGESSPENELTKDLEALQAKRRHILTELLETERIYVSEMRSISNGYKDEMQNSDIQDLIPELLKDKADILFGNIEEIWQFHNDTFLKDLENCIGTPELIGLCFVHRQDIFHKLYSEYCLNKPQSEALRRDVGDDNIFFKDCQRKLNHRLPLGAYLLKPVQRITKYQLLLKDLVKCNEGRECRELEEALASMLKVLRYVNDSMHQVAITGYPGNLTELGKLLMQGSFRVWTEHKNDRLRDLRLKPMQRHIFLHEKAVLFCKRSGKEQDRVTYNFKLCLKMSEVGLTETVRGSKGEQKKFELWLQGRAEVYIIQAPNMDVKSTWVTEIKRVLLAQFEHLKGEKIKQYSAKIQKINSVNGVRMAPPVHRPLRQTTSWDSNVKSELENEGRNGHAETPRRQSTRPASEPVHGSEMFYDNEQEEAWSSDYSSEDDDVIDPFGENSDLMSRFVALADYLISDDGEVELHEGDIVELLKVGCAGWWFVRVVGTTTEGWAPSSYLERITKRNSKSSPSVSSQESSNGMKPTTSKSSVTSSISITSQGDANG